MLYFYKEKLQSFIVGTILEKKLKIKQLTKQQITISLDRLTRFKHPEDKYLRVFKDIITSNLIEPKYKKSELDLMDYAEIKDLAQAIINYSINLGCSQLEKASVGKGFCICPSRHPELVSGSCQYTTLDRSRNKFGMTDSGECDINKKLLQYEKSTFKFDKNVEKLIDNKINYSDAISLFDEYSPLNLKWLKFLQGDENQIENRVSFAMKFPIEKVILAEGITEEILLPKFARVLGHDFDKLGINLISAGGKNQVVKLFYQFAETLKLPIFVLLDSDAVENFEEIKPKLRKGDKVHVLEKGEFEDVLPLNLIKRTLNQIFKNFSSVVIDDLRQDLPMTQILDEIFKQRGMEFKKAEFAALVGENISSAKDVSAEIEEIIQQLVN